MSALAAQQRQLRAAIADGRSVPGLLQGGGQLHIYRQAYAARLLAALRDNFGVLPRAMGDEAFEALGRAYLQARPSRHPSIRWFGDTLPAFMAARADLVPHPAFVDLARMEWALREAFDAADATPLPARALAGLPADEWPGLVLHFPPSLRLLALDWCVEPAWRALQADADADEPELEAPEAGAHTLLVWRPAMETRWRSAVHDTEARLLAAAMAGEPFAALCERAAADVGEAGAAQAVVSLLQQWLNEGLLATAA